MENQVVPPIKQIKKCSFNCRLVTIVVLAAVLVVGLVVMFIIREVGQQRFLALLGIRQPRCTTGQIWSACGTPNMGVCLNFATDAGKPCTDSDQCQGYCVGTYPVPGKLLDTPPEPPYVCSKTITVGCGCFWTIGDDIGKKELHVCGD